jgi:hypothetical protein
VKCDGDEAAQASDRNRQQEQPLRLARGEPYFEAQKVQPPEPGKAP